MGELEPTLICVNKPSGVTSHDVVAFWRRELRPLQESRLLVGHCGTLDPLATGLLLIVVGRAVKAQDVFLHHDKSYRATIMLGTETDTGDADGTVTETQAVPSLTKDQIQTAATSLCGTHVQPVPLYAAAKVNGRKLYEYARAGQEPPWRPLRYSTITRFTIISYDPQTYTLVCTIDCNAGTYIRSVAQQLAAHLSTVGHLTALERTAVGEWTLADALPFTPDTLLRSRQA